MLGRYVVLIFVCSCFSGEFGGYDASLSDLRNREAPNQFPTLVLRSSKKLSING